MFILLQPSRPAALAGVSCRLCGAQGPDAAFLDVRTGGEPGRRLAVRARKHLQVEIEEGAVCQPCAGRLEEWDRFYDQCRRFQDDVAAAATHGPTAVAVAVDDGLSKLVEELVQDSHGHHQQPAPPPPNSNGSDCLPNGPAVVPAEFAPEAIEGDDAVHDQPQADEEDRVDHDDDDHDDDDEEDGGEEEEDDDDDDDGEDHDDDNGGVGSDEEFDEDEESSDDSVGGGGGVVDGTAAGDGGAEVASRSQMRHKKFTFTIAFLERKVGRKFSSVERLKLQKHINKRQNTLIYEMLIGGGPTQVWRCQICDEVVQGRAQEVRHHYVKRHQSQPVFPCHVCDYTSRTEKMYQAHRMSHLVEYPCPHCSKVFTQHSRLVSHLNSHTNQRRFECDLCHKKFNTSQYVTTHKRKVHGDQEKLLKYTCELCGMRFKYKNHLQYHQKRHPTLDNPLPYSCKYCDQRFTTRAEQLAHSNTVHAGEGDYVCHLCGKKMKTILSLENHVKLHSGLKEFACELCGAAFATNHSLKCHRKIHQRPDHAYVCPVCKKTMSNKSSLNQHLKTHMGTKPYQCQHCPASFIHKNRLEIHMRKHTGEFPHTCADCGKGFRSTSSMNSHRQYVHSERKFACPVCAKAFKTARDLKVHATLHTGEKPNVCPICGKAFRVRANYFKHRKIHQRHSEAAAAASASASTAAQPTVDRSAPPDQRPPEAPPADRAVDDAPAPQPLPPQPPPQPPPLDHHHQDQPELVVVTGAAAAAVAADFFTFSGVDQQWIT